MYSLSTVCRKVASSHDLLSVVGCIYIFAYTCSGVQVFSCLLQAQSYSTPVYACKHKHVCRLYHASFGLQFCNNVFIDDY